MKNILFVLVMLPILLFTSCSKDDDLVVETEIWYIARNAYSGDNTITGTFCFFKDGDYDPTTFKYNFSSSSSNVWEDATIKNQKGETIKSFFIGITLRGKGYGTYKCEPGTYYVVALVKNASSDELWKAQKIQVEKNKVTGIDAIFGNMSAEGYVEWDD
ncbi:MULTISPECIES: hypothetical protein [Bacteroides]|mgnify:CR=1 FL=1|uniref:hypothetical protein n=1 Tax=Bacteroides TaxID=816 RepID=UPI0026749AA1|nr:hypothetical protein [Bacteroides acidifaciens]